MRQGLAGSRGSNSRRKLLLTPAAGLRYLFPAILSAFCRDASRFMPSWKESQHGAPHAMLAGVGVLGSLAADRAALRHAPWRGSAHRRGTAPRAGRAGDD